MRSRTIALASLAFLGLASLGAAQAPPPPPPPVPGLGGPLPGLTSDQLAAFNDGRNAFVQRFTPQQGLGPVFNDDSCVVCHGGGAPGGGSARIVTRFGRIAGGVFDPLAHLGGSLVQARAIQVPGCNVVPEVVPIQANVRTPRRSQPLFGLGLVDAVTDATLESLAALQRSRTPATAGRVNHVTQVRTGQLRAGRFGWKAQVVSLDDFSGDALLNELGITNPLFPQESCPQGNCAALACNPRPGLNDNGTLVGRLTAFQRFLAPPPRGPITAQVTAGEAVFRRIGCESCHASTLTTGPSTIAALDRKTFQPWGDFLLHDMGSLGDGIVQGEARGTEIRTAPLWGVSRQPRWLHDGRAVSMEQAIDQHLGQAQASRDQWQRLSATDRANLVAFLRSI